MALFLWLGVEADAWRLLRFHVWSMCVVCGVWSVERRASLTDFQEVEIFPLQQGVPRSSVQPYTKV